MCRDENVDTLFLKRTVKTGDVAGPAFDQFGRGQGMRGFDENVDIASTLGVVHAGTEQEYRGTLRKHLMSSLGNGIPLFLFQSHGENFMPDSSGQPVFGN